jgi:hypothetical protein
MRTLALGTTFGAAILLASIPAATQAAWKIVLLKDNQTGLDSRRGLLAAKTRDQQPEAMLEITCARGGQQLSVSTSADVRDTLDVRYRIDDRPQKQSVFVISGPNSISIRSLSPADIGYAKRLSVELMRQEGPSLLFSFNTVGANGVVNAISCGL